MSNPQAKSDQELNPFELQLRRPEAAARPEIGNKMKCPACPESDLVMSERQGVEIDYCPKCRGVWLDRVELDKMVERSTDGPVPSAIPGSTAVERNGHHGPHPIITMTTTTATTATSGGSRGLVSWLTKRVTPRGFNV